MTRIQSDPAATRAERGRPEARRRTRGTFVLTGLEHRGVRAGSVRLVCYVAGTSGLLAVWGTRPDGMQHVIALEDAIAEAGFPVSVECDWIDPDAHEQRAYHHRYWAMEADHFVILTRRS